MLGPKLKLARFNEGHRYLLVLLFQDVLVIIHWPMLAIVAALKSVHWLPFSLQNVTIKGA